MAKKKKKKKKIVPFACTWMDTEVIILSDISQTEKDKYYMISLICGILKIIQMNLFTKQKQFTNVENKAMVTKGEKKWRGINQGCGVIGYTLPYI